MVTIKIIPTVLSNYQEDDSAEFRGCGRNCLGKCCLPVSKLPLYSFKGDSSSGMNEPPPDFLLNSLLLGQDFVVGGSDEPWPFRLFLYYVTACETKVIPVAYGFIAQLNDGRHLKKRPTEFRIDRVLQPFDPAKFNFAKVAQEEQNDPSSFLLALHMAVEGGSPYFRLGYNSLGAFATINHLHFQAYFLSVPFPVERAPTQRIPIAIGLLQSGVKISQLLIYPVRGLVYEGGNSLRGLSEVVSKSCMCLQDNNIPFNDLISDSGWRIFLFPQCYTEKQALGEVSQAFLDTQVNPAVWEISGYVVLKHKKDFEEATEQYASRLLAEVSLSETRFEEVKAYIFEALELAESGKEKMEPKKMKQTSFQSSAFTTHGLVEGCLALQ